MGSATVANFVHPPLLRGFHPDADAIRTQIQPSVLPQANHILDRIPFFQEEGGTFITAAPSGKKLRLDDPSARQQAAKNAIGDYWELMNLAEFVFHFKKKKNAKVVFRIETTDYAIEFDDYDKCFKFLSDREAEWESWARGANADDGRRRSASRKLA